MRRLLAPVVAGLALVPIGCSDDGTEAAEGTTTTVSAPSTTAASSGALTPLQDVVAGQCLDEVDDERAQPFAVSVLPCEDPHVFEVYAQLELSSPAAGKGAPYPGDLTVANGAEEQCEAEFEGFMGIAWEASDYEIRTWWPMQQAWDDGERTVLCAVYRVTGGTTVGSVRGTKQ